MPAFQIGKIPQRIEGTRVSLRLLQPSRWLAAYRLFKGADRECLAKLGFVTETPPLRILLYSLYRFQWAYLLTSQGNPVGITGIYSWEPGCSLFIALAILDASFRGQGIGSEGLGLITSSFKQKGLCKEIWVEVRKENQEGLNFWLKNGFKLEYETKEQFVMKKKL